MEPKRSPGRPRKTPEFPDGLVEVRCKTHNVHLGDGRVLDWGDTALVTPELAEFLEGRGQVHPQKDGAR